MIRLLTDNDKKIIFDYLGRNEMETSFLYANVVEFGVDNRKNIRRCADYYGFFHGEVLTEVKFLLFQLGRIMCLP